MKKRIVAFLLAVAAAWWIDALPAQAKPKSIAELTVERFQGKYRKGPKTSIARTGSKLAPLKKYKDLHALLVTLPSDAEIRSKYPSLRRGVKNWPKIREPEETRNVQIQSCWIVSAKHEGGKGDRDFHVIISNSPKNFSQVMNVEVSALPKPANDDSGMLKDVRARFLALATNPPKEEFKHLDPPMHVRIEGSLYFDGDHGAGGAKDPGPAWAKPRSVWEIHPIYNIVALPN